MKKIFKIFVLILIFSFLFFPFANSSLETKNTAKASTTDWWDETFSYCRDISIVNVTDENLTDFPILIKLDYDSGMQTDFDDLRFVSEQCGQGGVLLDYEIDSYNSGESAIVWARLPQFSSTGQNISVYYGNPNVVSAENPSGVWQNNYSAVFHFSKEQNGQVFNSANGQYVGSVNNISNGDDGEISDCYYFDNGSKIDLRDSVNLISKLSGTVSWFQNRFFEDSETADRYVWNFAADSSNQAGFRWRGDNDKNWWSYYRSGTLNIKKISASVLPDWQWGFGAMTYSDSSGGKIFVNGEQKDTIPSVGDFTGDVYRWSLGSDAWGNNSWQGQLDEMRFSNIKRSDAWLKQEYEMVENNNYLVELGLEANNPSMGFCSDGTLHNQCSLNQPLYCQNGALEQRSDLCGCGQGYEPADNGICVRETSELGLIVINKNSEGVYFMRDIARDRDWFFYTTSSSDPNVIRNEIKDIYDNHRFNYLLMVGDNQELPFAVLDNDLNFYITDPALYADLNNDGFIELSIGRLPFSDEAELSEYFTDLGPKNNFYLREHYPLEDDTDDDTFFGSKYYDGLAMGTEIPTLEVNRGSGLESLVERYKDDGFISIFTHGSGQGFSTVYDTFYITNICPNCHITDLDCDCGADNYLSNRPVIFHDSCLTARTLGKQLISNGASAFVGNYNISESLTHSSVFSLKYFSGYSVGDSFVHIYNSYLIPKLREEVFGLYEYISFFASEGVDYGKIGTYNLNSENARFDKTGYILYGDPSIKNPYIEDLNSSITTNFGSGVISVDFDSAKIIYGEDGRLLPFHLNENVFARPIFWANTTSSPVRIEMLYDVTDYDIDNIVSADIVFNGVTNELDDIVKLIKGSMKQYLYFRVFNEDVPYIPLAEEFKVNIYFE
ncbi:MAG: DUF2341 domain-containing protein [bacterium]